MAEEYSARPMAADYIYEALVELMKQKPYDQITITDIVQKAGVSRMAYYRNYQSKDDILISHYRKVLSQVKDRAARLSQKEYWTEYVQRSNQDPIFEHILRAGLLGRVYYLMLDTTKIFYQAAYGLEMTDEKEVLMAYQKLGILMSYLIYRRDRPKRISTDALADPLAALMVPDDLAGLA